MGIKVIQTNFTAGVLDPLLAAREDISFYYNGLEDGENILVQPQGGVIRRGGFQHVKELMRVVEEIDLSGATITAPEGGTETNATDGDDETYVTSSGNIGTDNPFVLLHIEFASETSIDAVDLINVKLSSGSLDDEMVVQISDDNSNWTTYGTAFNIDALDRSRRIRQDGAVTASYLRVVRVGSTDTAATLSLAEIKIWSQTSTLSNGRLVPFAYSTEESYMMAVSDQNMDVLVGDDFKGAISVPHTSSQLSILNWAQSLDTLVLFHPDVWEQNIFRQGGDDEFDFRNMSFSNLPKHDYGAGTGGVNEVQTLNYGGSLSGGKITISLEGERTVTISSIGDSNIQSALRALNNTSSSGITVSAISNGFTVTFAGDDGSRPWLEMDVDVLEGTSVWTVSRTTKGEYPGEDIISDTRGHARCGVFYQSRLWMGGPKGVPDAVLASVVGIRDVDGAYDFNIDEDDDAAGLLFRAQSDQVSAIYQIVAGRNLTFFSGDAESYIPTEPIDKDAVLKLSTRTGIKEGVRVFEVDGALIFLQGDGASLREFLFVDTEQSYQANNISVLSSHLLKNPVDMARRKAVNTNETDLILIINNDGSATALATLRNQSVTAFTPLSLRDGDKFLAVGVDRQKRVYIITERSINGEARRFVERLNNDYLLDAGGIYTVPTSEDFIATADQTEFTWTFTSPASTAEIIVRQNGARLAPDQYTVDLGTKKVTLNDGAVEGDAIRIAIGIDEITGLDHLKGETVQTYIDGSPGEEVTISAGGVLSLSDYADMSVQYGFFFDIYGKLMPMRISGSSTLAGDKMRVYRVILSLYRTGAIQLRVNNGMWRDVPLAQLDTAILDKSMDELLFTGEVDTKGLSGYAVGGVVEFRQTKEKFGPLNVRAITREVSL